MIDDPSSIVNQNSFANEEVLPYNKQSKPTNQSTNYNTFIDRRNKTTTTTTTTTTTSTTNDW